MFSAGRFPIGTLVVSSVALFATTSSGALMSPGDIAFIGYNEDGNDDFAIVLLANAAASDVVHFNENEWIGTQFNSPAEGKLSWTVGATLSAGTVVTFSNVRTSPAASAGSLAGGTMSLSSREAIYAFLGPDAQTPQTFLAAISNSSDHYNGPDGTLSGTGLTQGTTAVLLPLSGTSLADGGQFKEELRTGQEDFSDYLPLIGNASANWDLDHSNGSRFVPFSTTPFEATSAAIPEPSSLSLMLLVTTIGVVRYRRIAANRSDSSASRE